MYVRTTAHSVTSSADRRPRHPNAQLGQHALTGPLEMIGAPMTFGRNVEIFGENEPAEYVYKVLDGAVRTYKILNDGRRQIRAFHLCGDVFGLELGEEHTFSAEAIVDSQVLVIKRAALMSLAARDSETANLLWTTTSRELQRVQDHALLLVKSAQERVAAFLLEMAGRNANTQEIQLPMSRQDIADYLGLTIETVSRTLTLLESEAAIALPSARRIVLRNRHVLRQLNS